jgi:hypothetical protein
VGRRLEARGAAADARASGHEQPTAGAENVAVGQGEHWLGALQLMTCKHDVKRITIDPSLLADDKDMLEDLVAAAFNDAVRKAAETSEAKMSKLTAGLPPGLKLPF